MVQARLLTTVLINTSRLNFDLSMIEGELRVLGDMIASIVAWCRSLSPYQAIPVLVEKHHKALQIILGEASGRMHRQFKKRLQLIGCHSFVRMGAGRLCQVRDFCHVSKTQRENNTGSTRRRRKFTRKEITRKDSEVEMGITMKYSSLLSSSFSSRLCAINTLSFIFIMLYPD